MAELIVKGPVSNDDRPAAEVPPAGVPYSWQAQAHTAALDNLADAIRELAIAIRTGIEAPTNDAASTDSPGPAKGLTTQIRPTPDHRNPNARSNLGFAPVKADHNDYPGLGNSEP